MRAARIRKSQIAQHLCLSRSEELWTAASRTIECHTGMSHNENIDILSPCLRLVRVLSTSILIIYGWRVAMLAMDRRSPLNTH